MARPRHYKSPEEFDAMVDKYVAERAALEKPMSWTGLALYLGFCSRAAIDEYQDYEGFSYSVKRAKTLIENFYEEKLMDGGGAGAIFALKNFKWRDKFEEDINRQLPPIIIQTYKDDETN